MRHDYDKAWKEYKNPLDSLPSPKSFTRYLDQFFRLKCLPDLTPLGVFPNTKEVTESFGAFCGVRFAVTPQEFGNNWDCVVIGDGMTPRTGVLFSFLTRWNVWSVDPSMRMKGRYDHIDRLHCLPNRIEDTDIPLSGEVGTCFISVHGHAPIRHIKSLWNRTTGRKIFLSMPCCVDQRLDEEPEFAYSDHSVLSEKRNVYIYTSK